MHRLIEVKQVCDRLTVLRDGKYVGDADVANTSMDEIVRMMVGRNVEYLPGEYHKGSEVVARVESLTRLKRIPGTTSVPLRGMSLEIRKGEVLGLADWWVREEPNWLARCLVPIVLRDHFISGRLKIRPSKNGHPSLMPSRFYAPSLDRNLDNPQRNSLGPPAGGSSLWLGVAVCHPD